MNDTKRTANRRSNAIRRRSSLLVQDVKENCGRRTVNFLNNGYVKLVVGITFFALCITFYNGVENWSPVECVLFVIVTATTVGYGNIYPTTDDSRVFTIFLMIFGAFVIFAGILSYLSRGLVKMNTFLARSVTSSLKRTEVLFQRRLALSILWVLTCALFGALIFQHLENWSYITALYFVVQTMTVWVIYVYDAKNKYVLIATTMYPFLFICPIFIMIKIY